MGDALDRFSASTRTFDLVVIDCSAVLIDPIATVARRHVARTPIMARRNRAPMALLLRARRGPGL